MADNETTGTGRPNWTARDNKSELDPLGMQTTSVALYPLSALSGIACTVAGRGSIFTDISLTDGRQLSLTGFDTTIVTAMAKAWGIRIDYDSRCASGVGIPSRDPSAARLAAFLGGTGGQ